MERRVVIVDFNHLLHTYYYSQHRLSIDYINVSTGEKERKDTTIQNGTLKSIFKWSAGGYNPTAVCFDRSCPARKAYYQANVSLLETRGNTGYKGNRHSMPNDMFIASSDVQRILTRAGVSCYAHEGYEADDLVFACIKRARAKYPGMHIDVITNDADLLALVDEDVSVYYRSKKGTFAENKAFEKNHYIEVTPRNYKQIVGDLSDYKGFYMPYNTILLHKLIRGDKSDEYGCKDISRMYPASKWNAMLHHAEEQGYVFGDKFRYGDPVIKIMNRVTGQEYKGTLKEALTSSEKANLYQKITNPRELDVIIEFLKKYSNFSSEQLSRIEKLYWGMNLNMMFYNSDPTLCRRSYVVGENNDINTFTDVDLHISASEELQIRLMR